MNSLRTVQGNEYSISWDSRSVGCDRLQEFHDSRSGKRPCLHDNSAMVLVADGRNSHDSLTLADDRLEALSDNPNALRVYVRDIGRMVLAAEGRKANDSHADCYQYFCVPEYGTANGRLHFHAVHFMRTLPTGSVGPNFGRRVRNRRQLNSLQNTWPYG